MTTIEQSPAPFNLPNHKATTGGVGLERWPQRPLHVILATTGSVASVKAPLIVKELLQYRDIHVQVVATEASLHFYSAEEIKRNNSEVKVWRDADEWTSWKQISDPILHIELRRWADVILVAPCSADILAKISGGLCDSLLTSLMRALNPQDTPVYLFPAMNTQMYLHPLTAKHLKIVTEELGYKVYGPIQKGLACGDLGIGAMYEWSDIVKLVVERYQL